VKKVYCFTFIVLALYACCSQRSAVEVVPVYLCKWTDLIDNRSPNDIVQIPMKEFVVKQNLHAILDTIIMTTEKCQKYKDAGIEFSFWVYIFNNKSITINIENVNIHCFNVEICDGVFSYRGYPFYYSGIFLDDLFEETGQTINKRMVKRKDMEYLVDTGLQWTFFYEDENFRTFTFDD